MRDIADHLIQIQRTVASRPAEAGELIAVTARRRYAATPADVWDACTDPERLARWFLPVKGDLRIGGSFQTEGNAGGEILACEAPRLLRVTWGGADSIVELRLTADGDDATIFELDHTVPAAMAGSGAGALWVGPGWDGALVGLAVYLEAEGGSAEAAGELEALRELGASGAPEAQELGRRSTELWAEAVEASGTATPEQLAEGTAQALAQFAPDLQDEG